MTDFSTSEYFQHVSNPDLKGKFVGRQGDVVFLKTFSDERYVGYPSHELVLVKVRSDAPEARKNYYFESFGENHLCPRFEDIWHALNIEGINLQQLIRRLYEGRPHYRLSFSELSDEQLMNVLQAVLKTSYAELLDHYDEGPRSYKLFVLTKTEAVLSAYETRSDRRDIVVAQRNNPRLADSYLIGVLKDIRDAILQALEDLSRSMVWGLRAFKATP